MDLCVILKLAGQQHAVRNVVCTIDVEKPKYFHQCSLSAVMGKNFSWTLSCFHHAFCRFTLEKENAEFLFHGIWNCISYFEDSHTQ